MRSGPPSIRDARDFGPPLPARTRKKGETSSLMSAYARFAVERG